MPTDARIDLEHAALDYRDADQDEKKAKARKEKASKALKGAIQSVVFEEVTPDKLEVEASEAELEKFGGDPTAWVKAQWPEYVIDMLYTEDGKNYSLTLREDLQFKKYEFAFSGYKFGRYLKLTGSDFNAEGFYAAITGSELPDVLKKVIQTEVVWPEEVTVWKFDEKVCKDLLSEFPELLPLFQEYNNRGTPQVSMLPIGKVKDEE